MIFRRKKTTEPSSPDSPDITDETLDDVDLADEAGDDTSDVAEPVDDDSDAADDSDDDDDDDEDDNAADDAPAEDPWQALDASQDWRDDGPFDYDEVDLEDDPVARLDLGSLIVTPAPGVELQIVADPDTGQGMALVAMTSTSALQVTLLAAPSSPGFATDVRDEMIAETMQMGGNVELAEGPFGTELRRVVPATDGEGNEGFAPLRDWFAQGPRWLLNARLMGAAAQDVKGTGEAAGLEDFFRNLIVRREDGAMVPGQVITLTIPTASA